MPTYLQELRKCNLTKRQMRCLAMWYFDGMTERGIAEVLGISHVAVHKLLGRGRKKLKAAGLRPQRRYLDYKPKLLVRDTGFLDSLGPDDIRAVW